MLGDSLANSTLLRGPINLMTEHMIKPSNYLETQSFLDHQLFPQKVSPKIVVDEDIISLLLSFWRTGESIQVREVE